MSSDQDFDWRVEWSVEYAEEQWSMTRLVQRGVSTGIGIALAILCCHFVWKKTSHRSPSAGSKVLFATVLTCLAIFVGETIFSLRRLYKRWYLPCFTEDSKPCDPVRTLKQLQTMCREVWITDLCSAVIRLLGDYTTVHRARAIVQDHVWLSRSMVAMFILTTVLAIAQLFPFRGWNCYFDRSHENAIEMLLEIIVIISSLLTNLVATASVCTTLWLHRRLIRKKLGLKRLRPTRVQQILTVISESGIVYALFQAFQLCARLMQYEGAMGIYIKYPAFEWVVPIADEISQTALGLYPGFIFVVIQLQEHLRENQYSLVELMSITEQSMHEG